MIRILIADDHTILRDGLRQILSECPDMTVVGEADSGHDVLAKVRGQDWDVLVLDMAMPGKSGIDLLKQIKSERPKPVGRWSESGAGLPAGLCRCRNPPTSASSLPTSN
jgi:DNA-binding NarL/FixJ family response regulator